MQDEKPMDMLDQQMHMHEILCDINRMTRWFSSDMRRLNSELEKIKAEYRRLEKELDSNRQKFKSGAIDTENIPIDGRPSPFLECPHSPQIEDIFDGVDTYTLGIGISANKNIIDAHAECNESSSFMKYQDAIEKDLASIKISDDCEQAEECELRK